MIAFIHEVENIAERYGLQITGLDVTDVTLILRMEVMPSVFTKEFERVVDLHLENWITPQQ